MTNPRPDDDHLGADPLDLTAADLTAADLTAADLTAADLTVADQPGHLSFDRLADLAAGLPDPGPAPGDGDDASPVPDPAEHLRTCARCRVLLGLLGGPAAEQVEDELRAAGPAPVPADVQTRIGATLAQLSGAPSDEQPDAPPAPVPGTVLPAARSRSRTPLLGLAAGLVGVLALVGVGFGIAHRPSGQSTAASGGAAVSSAERAAPRYLHTGTAYDRTVLLQQVPRLLTGSDQRAAAPAVSPQTDAGDPALQACLAEVAGPGGPEPLLVDRGTFQGQPALVVVLPGATSATSDVYVVGADCTTKDSMLKLYLVVPLR